VVGIDELAFSKTKKKSKYFGILEYFLIIINMNINLGFAMLCITSDNVECGILGN
jgi:hypothetical protein